MSQYIKKCSLFSLLVLSFYNSTTVADSWLDDLWNALIGVAAQEQEYRPRENTSIRQEISRYIDHVLATTSHSYRTQQKIQEKKDSFIRRIVPKIERMHHLTDIEKVQKAHQKAHAWMLQLVSEQTEEYARKHIDRIHRNLPINPALLKRVSDRQVVSNTTTDMLLKAQEAAENSRYASLKDFVGDKLDKQVEFKVEQQFGIHDQQAPTAHTHYSHSPRPSAPPIESAPAPAPSRPLYPDVSSASSDNNNNVAEIDPQFVSNVRSQDFAVRKEYNKLYRHEDCCICLDTFQKIGKRVTLFCGHAICPTCLFGHLHITKNNLCPLCQNKEALIIKDEFSVNYLGGYANKTKLKENFPNKHDLIDKLLS